MRGDASGSNTAAAELSELLVATMLVVVALALFLTSIGGMLVAQTELREDARMQAEAEDFCQMMRSSPLLTGEEPGVIPLEKMELLSVEDLRREHSPISQGFHYSIIIEDTSTYGGLDAVWVNTTDRESVADGQNVTGVQNTTGVQNATDEQNATNAQNYTWTGGNAYASSLPVLISVGSWEKHTGRLTVIIWGDGR